MKKIIIFITLVFFYINNVNSQNFSLDFTKEGESQKKLQYKSYENLILSVDDSINSLKEKGYIDASVNRFVQIDSLNYRCIPIVSNNTWLHSFNFLKKPVFTKFLFL